VGLDEQQNIIIYETNNDVPDKVIKKSGEGNTVLEFETCMDGIEKAVVDRTGNYYIAGYIYKSIGRPYGNIAKYNSLGEVLWVKEVADWTSGYLSIKLMLDSDDNIYLTDSSGLRKYDPEGELLWSYNLDPGIDPIIDKMGNIYLLNVPEHDVKWYLSRIDVLTGEVLWEVQYLQSTNTSNSFPRITFDLQGNLIIFYSVDISKYSSNQVVSKYDKSGNKLWSYELAGSSVTVGARPLAMTVDKDNNIIAEGCKDVIKGFEWEKQAGSEFPILVPVSLEYYNLFKLTQDGILVWSLNGPVYYFDYQKNMLETDDKGAIYINEYSEIRKYSADGKLVARCVAPVAGGIQEFVFDKYENMYMVTNNSLFGKYSL
jgi:hypothetical protein